MIDRGTSGGPVLDADGRVIGLATSHRRFWGVLGIDQALAFAEEASKPDARRRRIMRIPGIEYVLPTGPTGNRPKMEFMARLRLRLLNPAARWAPLR